MVVDEVRGKICHCGNTNLMNIKYGSKNHEWIRYCPICARKRMERRLRKNGRPIHQDGQ